MIVPRPPPAPAAAPRAVTGLGLGFADGEPCGTFDPLSTKHKKRSPFAVLTTRTPGGSDVPCALGTPSGPARALRLSLILLGHDCSVRQSHVGSKGEVRRSPQHHHHHPPRLRPRHHRRSADSACCPPGGGGPRPGWAPRRGRASAAGKAKAVVTHVPREAGRKCGGGGVSNSRP
jgi:hypothetical protein